MSKVVGSFESVVRGVSEQVPEQRHSGQHYEQVNMLSDPVHGLVRRHGSVTLAEQKIAGMGALTATQVGYARQYREHTFSVAGVEFSLIYQAAARPAGDGLPFAFCMNKDTGQFLPVSIVGGNAGAMAPWVNGGVAAITTVGQFVIMAANNSAPTYTVTDQFAAYANYGVAEVRTGFYSRTYKLTLKATNGVVYVGSYTTMASSYPTLLNTSDIPASASDYQKQVNDRVNAYNSAMNKWIGDAAASIQPENIAQQLINSLVAAGCPASLSRVGGTVITTGATDMQADDGGDGAGLRVVFSDLDDVSKLSANHYPGKVVRITQKGAEPFYMQAAPQSAGISGWQAVRWHEGAAQVITPQSVFAVGMIYAGTLYLAATPAALQAATGQTVPGYTPSTVGSTADDGATPYFFGKQVSCLSMFQDRLLVIANGVIMASRTGDYFNWFRKSKLTLTEDDPVEIFALGAEDDIIRHAVPYNKDAFLFGDHKQYAIPGRMALTPQSASVSVAANERDAASARPAVAANLVFYAKSRPAAAQVGPSPYAASINQFQLGIYQDTPEAYDISQQLGLYLRGKAIEMAVIAKPHTIILRTDGYDNGVFLYNYLDQQGSQSRAFDSWHRWEWSTDVGQVIGIAAYKSVLRVYTLRSRTADTWVACEEFTLDSAVSDRPHLDMQRTGSAYVAGTGFLSKASYAPSTGAVAATVDAGTAQLLGQALAQYDTFVSQLWPANPAPPVVVGSQFLSYVDITPPYTRDRNDVAIVNGRLVINRYSVRVADTGGMEAWLTNTTAGSAGAVRVASFNGRRVSLTNNVPSQQPLSDATLQVPIGRANTEHRVTFQAVNWLPLSIVAIEWVGQFFNNARRV